MFDTAEPFYDSAEESASDDDDMFGDAEPYDDFDDELEWIYQAEGQPWWTIAGLFWNHNKGYGYWSGPWSGYTWLAKKQCTKNMFEALDRSALDA